jgi:hypothetical protein
MVSQNPCTPDAAPDERVAVLLAAAAAPADPGPQPGEEQALAAFRASPHRTRRISMFSTPTRAKVAVASTIGAGVFLFTGVGAAAAGVLPDAAQDTASTVLGRLGFEVPRADDAAGAHPAQRGPAEEAAETEPDAEPDAETDTDTDVTETETDATETDATETSEGKGSTVSGLATSTDAEGVDKGAEISTYASGGKSRAGADHTARGAQDDADPDATPGQTPVEHPKGGSTPTADEATVEEDAAATAGTATADESGSGHRATGSEDRP